MAKSMSSLTDNPAGGLNNREYEDCYSSHEHMTVKDGSLTFTCANCNKIYEKKFDKDLFKKLKIHISAGMETLRNFVSSCRKVFIHMST